MSNRIKGYIPTLDGWRAIAILSVLVCHLTIRVPLPPHLAILFNGLGQKGVELFFCISGLLITSRLLEERRIRGRVSLTQFYIRRCFRILPPAFAFLGTLVFLGVLGVITISPVSVAAAALFTRNYFGADWYTGHYWSLAVEEHFYLLWPGILVLAGVSRARKVALFLILAVTAWRAWLWLPLGNARILPWFYFHTDTQLDTILCGALMALLLERGREGIRSHLQPVVALPILGLLLCSSVGATGPLNSLARLGQGVVISLILACTMLHPESWVSLVLEAAPLRWVGRLSYSLYLWQQLFLGSGLRFWPLKLAACFAAAAASYYLVERPAMRLGHRLARPTTEGRCDLLQTPEPREPEGQALLAVINTAVAETAE